MTDKKRKLISGWSILTIVVMIVVLTGSFTAFAWFYFGREAAGAKNIADPTAIFINAGNMEDIRYMKLSDINLEGAENYADYVFCIRGNSVSRYKLQLAYTTNNQVEYEIYPASLVTTDNPLPGSTLTTVTYTTHPQQVGNAPVSEEILQYFVASGTPPLSGSCLNRDETAYANGEILALTGEDEYYIATYTPDGSGSVYTHHDKYSVPIYWQTAAAVNAGAPYNEAGDFCDYYVLRIKWTGVRVNTKETDIIYISAKNRS